VKKGAHNEAQFISCENVNTIFTVDKSSQIICAISLIFYKKLPEVNSRPKGENSPNLVRVTRLGSSASRQLKINLQKSF
jgi:hypothetical protein